MRKRIIRHIFVFVLLLPLLLQAQTRQISGFKRNDKQEPVRGATVKAVGLASGTSTGNDGQFTLTVPSSAKQADIISIIKHACNTVNH